MAEINREEWGRDEITTPEFSNLKYDPMEDPLMSPINSIVEQIAKISGDKIKVHYDTVNNDYVLSPEDIVTASSQWAAASSQWPNYNLYYTDLNEVYVDYTISQCSLYIQDENKNSKKIDRTFTSYNEAHSYVDAKICAITSMYKKELKDPLIDVQFANKGQCMGEYFAKIYVSKDTYDNKHVIKFILQLN